MNNNQRLGKEGEDKVEKYLIKKRYKILDRNFECKRGEIDIIALDKDEIVFIEIKTRTTLNYGQPADAITKQKIKHILRTAEYYLYERNLEKEKVRIDAIEVFYKNSECKINHIKKII